MSNDKRKNDKEDILSSFIDDLNQDKKPDIYKVSEDLDDETLQLLETIRAVKRIKGNEQKHVHKNKKVNFRSRKFRGFTKFIAVAAVFVLIFTAIEISNIGYKEPKNTSEEGFNMFSPNNIAYAMMEAYNQLKSYSGIIEIRSEDNGEVDFLERIEIQYKKPNKYKAIHSYNGYSYMQISDGIKLYNIDDREVIIDYSNPEKELWRYHIENQINEFRIADDIKQVGEEEVLGRSAYVYEYTFSGSKDVNKLWVDKETKLPLKKELHFPENRKLTNHFIEIDINTDMDDSLFAYEPKSSQRVKELNRLADIEEIETALPITEKILNEVPKNLQLIKSVKLKDEFYDYLLKFRDTNTDDYFDIYLGIGPVSDYHFQGSELGRLGEGWTERMDGAINMFKVYIGESNYAKWVTADYEIMIVSSISSNELSSLLERVAGESIINITKEEVEKMGIKPTYTKEGH